jgi:SPP1 gp7 family putative phage head morphogenesis protein
MANISDKIADRFTARQVMTERFKGSIRIRVRTALRKLERELLADIAMIDPTGSRSALVQQRRLEKLLKQTQETIRRGLRHVRGVAEADLVDYAGAEVQYTVAQINKLIGAEVLTTAVAPELLREIAGKSLIHGAPSKTWWKRQAPAIQNRFADQMRNGVLRGESTAKLGRRVRGTKAAGYKDGMFALTRRQAETLARTAVQHVQNSARLAVFEKNDDVVKAIQWVATMDLRTTEICLGLHGLQWRQADHSPIGHSQSFPGPTAHWNCRSTQIPVLKSFSELSKKGAIKTGGRRTDIAKIWEKEAKAAGLTSKQIARSKRFARASMNGQIARDLDMNTWLKRRSFAEQSKLLGPSRARLFRDGKITLRDLIDQNNRPLTLSQLGASAI